MNTHYAAKVTYTTAYTQHNYEHTAIAEWFATETEAEAHKVYLETSMAETGFSPLVYDHCQAKDVKKIEVVSEVW